MPERMSLTNGESTEAEGFAALAELALDMRWSWNHATDQVWRKLDPELWAMTHNPWVVLQTVSRDKIESVLADAVFRNKVDELVKTVQRTSQEPAWFQRAHPESALSQVAYFSMEFMLSEALPIYSGGLGNVAGDQLKAASDLGVPVIGVGLLYQQGYFRQVIDKYGAQQELYPYNDPGQLPITPVRLDDGEWLRLEVALPGYSVWLRAWQVQVGKTLLAGQQRRGKLPDAPGDNERAIWRRARAKAQAGTASWNRGLAPS
jgi:starch phosphorylase